MGLLDNTTQQQYYQGNNFGDYQFTSLDDIINQFMIAYVGEDKIISRINRTDVQFHAMRAIQELSYDVLRSVKSQEIEVPPSLKMILPQDYVNYVKLATTGDDGIVKNIYYDKSAAFIIDDMCKIFNDTMNSTESNNIRVVDVDNNVTQTYTEKLSMKKNAFDKLIKERKIIYITGAIILFILIIKILL